MEIFFGPSYFETALVNFSFFWVLFKLWLNFMIYVFPMDRLRNYIIIELCLSRARLDTVIGISSDVWPKKMLLSEFFKTNRYQKHLKDAKDIFQNPVLSIELGFIVFLPKTKQIFNNEMKSTHEISGKILPKIKSDPSISTTEVTLQVNAMNDVKLLCHCSAVYSFLATRTLDTVFPRIVSAETILF